MNAYVMKNNIKILLLCLTLIGSADVFSQSVAVKSNLLYGAVGEAPNMGIETALSPRTTLLVWGGYNPFPLGKNGRGSSNRKMKHWLAGTEFRYWLCERFNGQFLGTHLLGGKYNIGGTRLFGLDDRRVQGYAIGAGISYGYQWILSPRWNLEVSAGIGYMRLGYDKYTCALCGEKLATEKKNYIGPTRAAISFIYLIR